MASNLRRKSGSSASRREAVRSGASASSRVRGKASGSSAGMRPGASSPPHRTSARRAPAQGARSAQRNNPRYAAQRGGSSSRFAGDVRAGARASADARTSGRVRAAQADSARRMELSSVRLGDIGRNERASRRREGGRRLFAVLGVAVALVCALCVAGLALGNSPLFTIEDVEVKGAEHLTESDMAALAPIPDGATLFNLDVDALERSILRDAWVQDVQIKRKLPSTVEIVVTERAIGAVVEVVSSDAKTVQPWAIAPDGTWLMAIPDQDSEIAQSISPKIYEDAETVLHITDVPYGLAPEMGTCCTDGNVGNALAIVAGMTTSLADQVKAVSATDAESTLLTLENGVEIAFGTADNIRDKERICLEIMEENEGRVAYINVRVVDRPTWRSV